MTELQRRKQEKIRRAHLRKRDGCVTCMSTMFDPFETFRRFAEAEGYEFQDRNGHLKLEFGGYYDLDHVDPRTKVESISNMIHKYNGKYSLEEFDAELDKTQCLCTLHHRQKTQEERSNGELQGRAAAPLHVQAAGATA